MKRGYKRRRKIGLMMAAVAAVLLAVLAVVVFSRTTLTVQQWEELYRQGTFYAGIQIDGIDVGGLTMAQAKERVSGELQQRMAAVQVTLVNKTQQFVLDKNDFIIKDNADSVLKEALAVAREGNCLEIARQKSEIEKNGVDFTTDYTVDTAPVKRRIHEIALSVDVPAKDAAVQVNKDDRKNRFSYTDEAGGWKVDQEALYAEVERRVRLREYGVVQMPILAVEPTVTKAELVANTVLRATASTSFAKSPYNRESRVYNIKKAVELINGSVLPPGRDFSANGVIGPRVYELGWQPAPAVVRGTSEDQAGGGVCQVSTTMYNAVLKADLDIVYRQGHSIKLSYVDGGLDATINTGTIDFVFGNSTDHNLYIFCYVSSSAQTVNFEIYGAPFPDAYDEIRLSSEKLETLQPPGDMIVMVDKTKPCGYEEIVVKRREGAVYATYKHYYKNGKEVKEPELIGKTKYRPYAGEKIIGPPVPANVQTPEESAQPVDHEVPGDES